MLKRLSLVLVALAVIVPSARAAPTDPDRQAANLALATTRGAELTPEVLSGAAAANGARTQRRLALAASDPERAPDPNPCTLQLCAPDPRLQGWADRGGLVEKVTFTARDGATLSGNVWATRSGPAKRPGVLVINGSIVGFEQAYWWGAQALAKAGYVVFTFDAQGEGDSDQFGAAPDQREGLIAGTPPFGDGVPFYDGGEDALEFFLSTPEKAYVPVPSRTSGTSHAEKQRRRVAAGLNPASNPLAGMLDQEHLGVPGHSFGANAASYLAQSDPRLDAVVGWDTLCVPRNSTQTENQAGFVSSGPAAFAGIGLPTLAGAVPNECFGAPPGRAPNVPVTKPGLALNGDCVTPTAYPEAPDPGYKAGSSKEYSAAGVDSASITIRGGNHIDFSWAPIPVGTLRGIDMSAWYTVAWFDKFLKDDPTADPRLLSGRWREDAIGKANDPSQDPNLYSELYRSRIDLRTDKGERIVCEDLRNGCPAFVPPEDDCGPRPFGFVPVDTAPDSAGNTTVVPCSASRRTKAATGCTSKRKVTITVPKRIRRKGIRRIRVRARGAKVTRTKVRARVKVSFNGRAAARGERVTVRLRVTGRTRTVTRRYRLCRPSDAALAAR